MSTGQVTWTRKEHVLGYNLIPKVVFLSCFCEAEKIIKLFFCALSTSESSASVVQLFVTMAQLPLHFSLLAVYMFLVAKFYIWLPLFIYK